MLPNLPVISNIYVEDDFQNNFQKNNVEQIIERVKKLNRTEKQVNIIYLKKDDIYQIKSKEIDYKVNLINNSNTYDLIIMKNPGVYIKKCPGTPNYICCNYFITTFYENCSLNCTYCFLRFYLKNNFLIIYYDIDNFIKEIRNIKKIRIGSGELSDSLLFDPYTNYSDLIMDTIKEFPLITFEFKTKTTYCKPFFERKPVENVVIGFSMNPSNIAEKFEPLATKVEERLEIARQLVKSGWKVAFHFDPIILTLEDDPQNYLSLFEEIIKIDNSAIAWFSLGSLRYHPKMMEYLREDNTGKKLLNFETISGLDGKVRYFIKDRLDIYKKIVEIYKNKNCIFPLYFCMESDKVYMETFGKLPNKIDNLKDIFTY